MTSNQHHHSDPEPSGGYRDRICGSCPYPEDCREFGCYAELLTGAPAPDPPASEAIRGGSVVDEEER